MLGGVSQKSPVVALLIGISAVLITGVTISATGMRPFGEAEMLRQIDREDSQLCGQFGMTGGTERYRGCMRDLAALRQRHLEMVASYNWP